MAILIDAKTRTIVQGITGKQGQFHTQTMIEYNPNTIVGGVTPGKGGQETLGVSVFDSVQEAVDTTNANTSIIFVPAPFCADAVLEAIDSYLSPIVVITEGIPVKDEILIMNIARQQECQIVGPNTPGVISPGKAKLGIMPNHISSEGRIGIVSRSGTLTHEVSQLLMKTGFGESTIVGIGGDPIIGVDFVDVLKMFKDDPQTEGVALIGEIGGNAEELAADYIADEFEKPVIAFIAGRSAPPGKKMGHAGAIITGKTGTAKSKINALIKSGVRVVNTPTQMPEIFSELL
ncbi:MAG: succinate--CoA ligase subunit alpha [Candidatus Heimdallarchaeota archaeon]